MHGGTTEQNQAVLTYDIPYDESNFPRGEMPLPNPTLSSIASLISEKEASGAFPESNLCPCEILLQRD